MRRSSQVLAPLVASAALGLLTACRQQPEMQRCVDEHNVVVADNLCKNVPAAQTQGTRPGGMGMLPLLIPYHYYYGGYGGYGLGSTVGGGGFVPSSGRSYSTTSGVSRGGGFLGGGHSSGTSRGGFGSSFGGGGHGGGE